jgi:hypothetical protein
MLQRSKPCDSAAQHVENQRDANATQYNVLQRPAMRCNTVQRVVTQRDAMQHSTTCCNAARCNTAQRVATQRDALQQWNGKLRWSRTVACTGGPD